MSSTVKSVAYVYTADIDPTVVKNGATWERLGNICVTAAENARRRRRAGTRSRSGTRERAAQIAD